MKKHTSTTTRTLNFSKKHYLACTLLYLIAGCSTSKNAAHPSMPEPPAVQARKATQEAARQPEPIPSPEKKTDQAATRDQPPEVARQPALEKGEKAPVPPARPAAPTQMVAFDFQDVDLNVVLRTLAKIAGINFVVAQGVKAQVTMRVERFPSSEVFSIIQAILEVNGLTAVKSGDIYKIVPLSAAVDVRTQQRGPQQVFVYHVQNAKASELAGVLKNVFEGESSASRTGLGLRTASRIASSSPDPLPPPRPGVQPLQEPSLLSRPEAGGAVRSGGSFGEVHIVADERSNILIIKASTEDYEAVKKIIESLDKTPKQVVIEALIVEVTLTDALSLGVENFIRSGKINNPEWSIESIAGLALTFMDRDRFRLVLTALESYTKINTLAAPHILTQDNKEARIQVGDEIPIVTGTQSTVTSVAGGGENLFQTIQQRDVGRILAVRPHVNEDRQVTLDVELEVSGSTGTGAAGSPIISERTAKTSVVLNDGQSLMIGGMISSVKDDSTTGIPLLSRIPYLGALFSTTTNSEVKTELLILLTPHVIANAQQGKEVTEQYRQRANSLDERIKEFPLLDPATSRIGNTTP